MNAFPVLTGFGLFLFSGVFAATAMAAPPCKGPNKNDPGCVNTVAVTPALANSVTVDWFNQILVVRGSGFTSTTAFALGGTAVTTANVTDTQLYIPFSAAVATEVVTPGNYNLFVDGVMQLTVFVESQIVDPAATGCPCESDWMTELGSLYTDKVTDCYEVEGPAANDVADISGTILSDEANPDVYPQYPIGASFYPGDPDSSVCRLAQVNPDASVVDLTNLRINENQQADCATALKTNVCTTVTPLP